MKVRFKEFSGRFSTEQLLEEAATCAAKVGRDRLIGVSRDADGGFVMVVVRYWG